MSELLVTATKVKEYAKTVGNDVCVAGDFSEGLSKKVEELIKTAVERANANGRKTVQVKDL